MHSLSNRRGSFLYCLNGWSSLSAMDAIELEISVLPCRGRSFTLTVDITSSTTTSDILDIVRDSVNSTYADQDGDCPHPVTENDTSYGCQDRGRWTLHEKWMDIERKLPKANFLQLLNEWGEEALSDVKFIAKEKPVLSCGRRVHKKKKRLNESIQLRGKQLSCHYQIRQLRLMQIKRNMVQSTSDPAQKGLMVISSLNKKCKELKADNEKLSSEVSEMNHEATKLSEHLSALRTESERVVEMLTQMKAESKFKKDKEDREKQEKLALLNAMIHRCQQKLDKRQRITELQDQKLKKTQNDINALKAVLQQKQTELKQLKEWCMVKKKQDRSDKPPNLSQSSMVYTSSGSQIGNESFHAHESSLGGGDSMASFESTSSFGSAFSRKASGSIRRRFADFEDRTKQLLDEESKAFKESKPKQEDTSKPASTKISTLTEAADSSSSNSKPTSLRLSRSESFSPVLVSPLSTVPTASVFFSQESLPSSSHHDPYSTSPQFYSLRRLASPKNASPDMSLSSSNSVTNLLNQKPKGILKKKAKSDGRSIPKPGIKFAPESILLNAAWEGELDLVKNCLKQLGTYKVVSGLGVTCLHNAVCSGNLELVDFLIQQNYDINAQDYQGWTPLHCAAAYCIFSAIQLLIKNGASVFMTNMETMTAIDISKEEMEGTQGEEAKLCYTYLMEYHKSLGVINSGTVYTLFSYSPESTFSTWSGPNSTRHQRNTPMEMPFIKGEKLTVIHKGEDGWWEVEDAQGIKGLVPSSYLGLYPPYQMM